MSVRDLRKQSWLKSKLRRGLLLAGMTVLSSACQFQKLNQEYAQLRDAVMIQGTVVSELPIDTHLVTALFARKKDSKAEQFRDNYTLIDHQIVGADGRFTFMETPGIYALFAFIDANADLVYQPSERVIGWGHSKTQFFQPFLLKAGTRYEDFDLVIPKDEWRTAQQIEDGRVHEMKSSAQYRQVTWDDPLMSKETGDLGLWEPNQWLTQFGGVTMAGLAPYDSSKIPVVFVHGAAGNPGELRALAESLDPEKYQPIFFVYPSGFYLDLPAQILYDFIAGARIQFQADRVFLVAHSMGGLVARGMLRKYEEKSPRPFIDLFVTFDSPFGGHSAASLGMNYAPTPVMSWADIVPGSEYIHTTFSRRLPQGVEHHLFFGYEGGTPLSSDAGDGSVSVDSQLFGPAQRDAEHIYGYKQSHLGILSDPLVLRRFKAIMADAAAQPPMLEQVPNWKNLSGARMEDFSSRLDKMAVPKSRGMVRGTGSATLKKERRASEAAHEERKKDTHKQLHAE